MRDIYKYLVTFSHNPFPMKNSTLQVVVDFNYEWLPSSWSLNCSSFPAALDKCIPTAEMCHKTVLSCLVSSRFQLEACFCFIWVEVWSCFFGKRNPSLLSQKAKKRAATSVCCLFSISLLFEEVAASLTPSLPTQVCGKFITIKVFRLCLLRVSGVAAFKWGITRRRSSFFAPSPRSSGISCQGSGWGRWSCLADGTATETETPESVCSRETRHCTFCQVIYEPRSRVAFKNEENVCATLGEFRFFQKEFKVINLVPFFFQNLKIGNYFHEN